MTSCPLLVANGIDTDNQTQEQTVISFYQIKGGTYTIDGDKWKVANTERKKGRLEMGTPGLSCFFSVEMCLYKKHFKPDVGQILATSGIAYQMDANNHGTVAITRAARRWEWIAARLKIRWGEMYAGFEETSYDEFTAFCYRIPCRKSDTRAADTI